MGKNIAERVRRELVDYLVASLKDPQGRVHVEDLISAAAAVVGERCLEAAGDFNPRRHQFAPGSPVFSDAVNELLAGPVSADLAAVPPDTVFGRLRDSLLANGYEASAFPDIKAVFRSFADGVGKGVERGWVPLTVSADNRPLMMPLRAEYATRAGVDRILRSIPDDPRSRLIVATQALAQVLIMVRSSIAPSVALLLAFETVNGMSKTAPAMSEKPWWRFW